MKHLGDITKIHGDKIEPVDCITFGSPCQDLSIAGRRAGLAGERSGLFMEAVRIIKEMRSSTNGLYPTFAVWENVPGAFSSNGGEDFRAVLEELARVGQPDASIPRPSGRGGRWSKAGAIAGNGWSLAWRQLDAQYWGKTIYDGRTGSVLRIGTPQRRKRIALVADFRGQRAAEILFERTSVPGNHDESIPTWKEIAGLAANRPAGNDRMVGAGCGRKGDGDADCRRTETDKTREADCSEREEGTDKRESREAAAYSLKIRSGCAGGGKGALVQTEKVGTLSTLQDQTLFQAIPVLNDQGGGAMSVSYNMTGTLRAAEHGHQPIVFESNAQPIVLESNQIHATITQTGICPTLPASMGMGGGYIPMITDRKVFDARGNGDGKIVPTITGDHENRITDYTAIAIERQTFNEQSFSHYKESDKCSTLKAKAGNIGNGSESMVVEKTSIAVDGYNGAVTGEKTASLTCKNDGSSSGPLVAEKTIRWIVRRLTPVECERLQGFPDNYSNIGDWTDSKGKKHKYADSPRYKALGNSIALPQWFWMVQRMRPYLKEKPTLGSLFDGLGGFPLVWQRAYGEGTARWASEIESFCVAVTKRRFGEE